MVDLLVLLCIVASIVLIPLEFTHPEYAERIWQAELGFTAIFVVEYLLRWYAAPRRWRYPFGFYAVIDLLAILPTMLTAGAEFMAFRAVRGLRLLRLLRVLRAVRLLRMLRYGYLLRRALARLTIWLGAIIYQYRLKQLGRLALYVVIAWVVGANVLHLTELRLAGPDSPYANYWHAYWNVVVLLISGIEDKEPRSVLGSIEVTAMLIVGIVMVGLLTGEIVGVLVRRVQRAGRVPLMPPGERMTQHIVVLGRNRHLDQVVRQVMAALRERHYVLLVSQDADQIVVTEPSVYRQVLALPGDPADRRILEQANVAGALRVIVLAEDDGAHRASQIDNRSLMRTLAVLGHARHVPVVTEILDDESLGYASHLEGPEFVLSRQMGVKLLARAVLEPGLTGIFDELLTFTTDSSEFYTLPVLASLVGKSFPEAQRHFVDHDDEAVILIGVDRSPQDRPGSDLLLAPTPGDKGAPLDALVLREGDRLVFIAYELPRFAEVDREDLWQGKILLSV
ncbi:MAG: ion transporter [Pseudomonadota bacterium]